MLTFRKAEDRVQKPCTPNILPCRIHYDGPVDASPRYWAPETAKDGKLETYFRGRKLRGQEIGVPQDYRGVVVQEARNEKAAFERIEKADVENEEGYEMEEQEEITIWREVGSFDNLLLWNHESMIDGNDAFVKGLSEWIGFAEAMHAPGEENS